MKFTKMHGLGNDYVYLNGFTERVADAAALSRIISDRHTGIGSDGLILIQPSRNADVRMEMYNADGSRGEMCGNGIRCVAKYAVERGLARGPKLRIETDAGIKAVECVMEGGKVASVRVDMGRPELKAKAIPTRITADRVVEYPLRIGGVEYRITCVSMGNPHAVVFVHDLHKVDLVEIGPKFEHAPDFPNRINTHFVRVDSPTHVTMRTWERGSGATRACGTGACAVCVAGVLTRRTERRITTCLPGGELQIEWPDDDHVYMTGEAVEVFTGDWPG
jgi:diaminopimelate epimerase